MWASRRSKYTFLEFPGSRKSFFGRSGQAPLLGPYTICVHEALAAELLQIEESHLGAIDGDRLDVGNYKN